MALNARSVLGKHPSTNGSSNGAAARPPKPFPAYYDLSRRAFYHEVAEGTWINLTEEAFTRVLRASGFSRSQNHANSLTWLEAELMRLQLENCVVYAGELAGYPAGLHEVCGQRCLITKGPVLPQPGKGTWRTLERFFSQLLGDWQRHFFGWLKSARQALRSGPPWRPGQILVLAGPAGCGKNLCQSIITEILGGRAAKPYRYMTGETSFNKELLSSEHLVIQDEAPLQDLKARRIFGARIKDFVVNEMQSFHPKGRDAISLTPFWRLSISLNEEAENLQILPPLDDSLRDKIMLFKCRPTKLPFNGQDPRSRGQFREQLSRELPAFLDWLKGWRVPESIRDQRFGVRAALDPTLVAEIDSLSPELKLWSLIESSGIVPKTRYGWCGSATELEAALRDKYRTEVDRLLSWSTACGVYMARLEKKFAGRIKQARGPDNTRLWRILHAEVAGGSAPSTRGDANED